MTAMTVNLGERSYEIHIGKNLLNKAGELFNLDRRALILTDENVPKEYSLTVAKCCKEAEILTLASGEGTKSLAIFEQVLLKMVEMNMTRSDCLVAVGGGVIGDLAGFAASSYMRGIDFYNIPTTLLAQVDSSIGGKTAVNLGGVKNIVGAFYQPKGVLIDTETLKTLPERHYAAGLCEAIKMALCFDKELFECFEEKDYCYIKENIEFYITKALDIKRKVVESDEREKGLRKALNFGHTLGHGIESAGTLGELYHGECVSLGMLPFCSDEVKERLVSILTKVGLPTQYNGDLRKVIEFATHDKKNTVGGCDAVFVERVGECFFRMVSIEDLEELAKRAYLS